MKTRAEIIAVHRTENRSVLHLRMLDPTPWWPRGEELFALCVEPNAPAPRGTYTFILSKIPPSREASQIAAMGSTLRAYLNPHDLSTANLVALRLSHPQIQDMEIYLPWLPQSAVSEKIPEPSVLLLLIFATLFFALWRKFK